MFVIRSEHLEAFQPVADDIFASEVVNYLRENHGDAEVALPNGTCEVADIPDDVLQEMVLTGIGRARKYGMTWESSLASYVVLMFEAAPNFDSHPLVQRVLRDENIEPDERMEQLLEQTTEQNWEAVRENYDGNAWLDEEEEAQEAA